MGRLLLPQLPHAPAMRHTYNMASFHNMLCHWSCFAKLHQRRYPTVTAVSLPLAQRQWRTMRSISSVVTPGLTAACALSRMVRAIWHALREPSICSAVLMGTAHPHQSHCAELCDSLLELLW